MIILIHNDMELWDFMTDGLKSREDVYDIPLNRYCSIIHRFLRKYFGGSRLPYRLVFGKRLIKIFKELKAGDKVVVSDYIHPCLFHAITEIVSPDVSVSLWLWNPIKNNSEVIFNVNRIESLGVKCSTFDSEDARRLNLTCLNTFYNMNVKSFIDEEVEFKYDFYFLGVLKDRGDMIYDVQQSLVSYKSLFIVPSQPSEYITYADNIKNIKSAKCLIDITQRQQHDITLRPLEAIAYKRKLVTNNNNIKKYPFYSPDNIFIFGVDPMESIGNFLESPYVDNLSSDIVNQFDINYWLDRV